MIFSCGLTDAEQNRRREAWHRVFAVLPRSLPSEDGHRRCVWLQFVWRRWGHFELNTQYATLISDWGRWEYSVNKPEEK